MSYRLTETALADLEEILDYIVERDGVDRAIRIHTQFLELFDEIAADPDAGLVRLEVTGPAVRWRRLHRWLVWYSSNGPVTVLRVIHGARALERLLGPSPESGNGPSAS